MRHLWNWLTLIAVAHCAQQPFSVQNDLLAYPQYEILFSDDFILETEVDQIIEDGNTDLNTHKLSQELSRDWNHDGAQTFDMPTDISSTYERMILRHKPYLCTIPTVVEGQSDNETTTTQAEQQQELVRASDHGWELLQGMEGNCLYYISGWWVYSFCYNDNIKQFHPLPPGQGVPFYPPTEDKLVQSYVLGTYDDSNQAVKPTEQEKVGDRQSDDKAIGDLEVTSQLQTRGETNFLVQKLAGGTTCDLTGRPRRIEVQFHCNPSSPDKIDLIKEIASCVYLMVVHTPRLCNNVAFMPAQTDKPNLITCQEIVAELDVPAWKAIKLAEESSMMHQVQQQVMDETIKRLPVLGGIEVGGRRLVGDTPDRTIKPSELITKAQVAGGIATEQEEFVATMAKSDGTYTHILSESEMKKKGIKGSKKKVDEMIAEMHAWAGEGVPWKLDIVRTKEGLEFRGTSDQDEKDVQSKTDQEPDAGSEEKFKIRH